MNGLSIAVMSINILLTGILLALCVYKYLRDSHRVALILSVVFFFTIAWVLNRMFVLSGFIPGKMSIFININLNFFIGFLIYFATYLLIEDSVKRAYGMLLTLASKLVPIYAFVTVAYVKSPFWVMLPSSVFLGLSQLVSGLIIMRYFNYAGKDRKIRFAMRLFWIGLVGQGLTTPFYVFSWDSQATLIILQVFASIFKFLLAAGLLMFLF